MKKAAKSVAEGLLKLSMPRRQIQLKGNTSKAIKEGIIEPTWKQIQMTLSKLSDDNNQDSILKNRVNNFSNSSTFGKPYRLITESAGGVYDLADRLVLEEGVSTTFDAAHSLGGFGLKGFGWITGGQTNTNFQSRDYISQSNSSGKTYDKNRLAQVFQGVKDISKGLIYGEANQNEDNKGKYKPATGVLGLAKTVAIDSWSQGVTQTFQNTYDSIFGTVSRTTSGVKNTLTGSIATPFYITDKVLSWTGEKIVGKAKNTQLSKPNVSINFNPSNFRNARDEEDEFKSIGERFASVFKEKN